MSDLKIPSSTLAELRGVLVRALSRENLSMSDKLAIRKSESSSSLKIHCTWSSSYGGKQTLFLGLSYKFRSGLTVIYLCCQRVVSVCVQIVCRKYNRLRNRSLWLNIFSNTKGGKMFVDLLKNSACCDKMLIARCLHSRFLFHSWK